ncbi:MAG TPA: SUMF1/EgtB/PvdO family nonheme iron enzyme [Spirochaetota bacterium]|nr:SUMF1/EgtB/PvdO family nonheme iron enzyme [Spirochaetota bacterium]HQP49195.1 SUMF1/EgtB/PvdO family nonheme iron enzyme [Spirochaetota bacterium]
MHLPLERFIRIKSGYFSVGLDMSRADRIDEAVFTGTMKRAYLYNSGPAVPVHIDAVYLSKTLITLYEFNRFIEDTGYCTEAEQEGWGWTWEKGRWCKKDLLSWRYPFRSDADAVYSSHAEVMPVLQVSWNDAAAFCSWISTHTGMDVRLPMEKEWEVFASLQGVPSAGDYHHMDFANREEGFIPLTTDSFVAELVERFTKDTSFHPPGVLWEWCGDWFDAYPGGPENREFGKTYRVLRGGSLNSNDLQRSREYRFRRCPTARSPFYGFRVAFPASDGSSKEAK